MKSQKNYTISVLDQTCPRCRKGPLFKYPPYNLKHFTEMNKTCACCSQKFELEPSFYDGAMYVSYAIQVALFVSVFVAYQVLNPDADILWKISTVIFLVFALFPLILRWSRSLWIHFFVKFDKQKAMDCSC